VAERPWKFESSRPHQHFAKEQTSGGRLWRDALWDSRSELVEGPPFPFAAPQPKKGQPFDKLRGDGGRE
jgi:hypothetical protein